MLKYIKYVVVILLLSTFIVFKGYRNNTRYIIARENREKNEAIKDSLLLEALTIILNLKSDSMLLKISIQDKLFYQNTINACRILNLELEQMHDDMNKQSRCLKSSEVKRKVLIDSLLKTMTKITELIPQTSNDKENV